MVFLPPRPRLALFSALLSLVGPLLVAAAYDPKACNNSPDLCQVPYASITHLGTHNSPFLRDKSTSFSVSGNQYFNVTVQLDAGVRLLQGQLHASKDNKEPHLCHSSCVLMDGGTLGAWLAQIKTWMDGHPSEVVTLLIVNDDKVSPSILHKSFTSSKASDIVFTPESGLRVRNFPTLQKFINDNKRLIVFATNGGGDAAAPYILSEFEYIWETKWENKEESEMASPSCQIDRPSKYNGTDGMKKAESNGYVGLLNWFLYKQGGGSLNILTPYEEKISNTNGGLLAAGMKTCGEKWVDMAPPHTPTYVLVDFFNEGPAIAQIDKLNNITAPVNRITPPATPKKGDKNTNTNAVGKGLISDSPLDDLLRLMEVGYSPTWADWIWAAGKWGAQPDFEGLKDDFNRLKEYQESLEGEDGDGDDDDDDDDDDDN